MIRRAGLLGTIVLAIFAMTVALGQDDEEVVTNANIVTLFEAGLSPSAIVAVIESQRSDFDTSVAQLAALSRAGVDSTVIEAMTRASASGRAQPRRPPRVLGRLRRRRSRPRRHPNHQPRRASLARPLPMA